MVAVLRDGKHRGEVEKERGREEGWQGDKHETDGRVRDGGHRHSCQRWNCDSNERKPSPLIYPSHLRNLMMMYHKQTCLLGKKQIMRQVRPWRWTDRGKKKETVEQFKAPCSKSRRRNEIMFVSTNKAILCVLMRMWIGLPRSQYQAYPFIYNVEEICVVAAVVLRCCYIPIREASSTEKTDTGCRLNIAFIKVTLCSPYLMKYSCDYIRLTL